MGRKETCTEPLLAEAAAVLAGHAVHRLPAFGRGGRADRQTDPVHHLSPFLSSSLFPFISLSSNEAELSRAARMTFGLGPSRNPARVGFSGLHSAHRSSPPSLLSMPPSVTSVTICVHLQTCRLATHMLCNFTPNVAEKKSILFPFFFLALLKTRLNIHACRSVSAADFEAICLSI